MKTSISDGLPYIDFCNKVMNNPEMLKDFRRNPDYDLVVPGNRPGDQMFEHLELIKNKYPEMLEHMPLFEKKQGVFGNPKMYEYDVGTFDVPVIIHIYYLALTIKYFGDLDGMHICEIGPGAGLFFKLVTDLYNVTYTFVDLPAPLFINRKHVEFLEREHMVKEYLPCNRILNTPLERKYDLVISDCAFNELHKDVQKVYIEKILNKSKRGRIAFYDVDINEVIPNLNINEVYDLLNHNTKIIQKDLRVPTLYWKDTDE